ncbi:hypothetical protein A7985_11190 [Pseudoalteromonas luteoviolacea]|uniref:Uncharacterized protein n=1 Tax=Pseudoalteromonas luteoviolacea TaxID=43657 RepID=A0A1C0TQE3_9GAMM|nr:hypothetical protein [Pseudoalteromonas luteoviolacea]KZN37949.1 hypothetical protein N480_14490 [Pseudoalteromonas luteoviolacea S2607]MBQ4811425.1 hypothetical protein [Pseudoalteromonas luteoviolacea]OCQ21189.1 hypothetical protein A7985_11190 [Pseudoalteromonas luteoviolacea]
MTDNKNAWKKQEKAVRATQLAFDLSSEVQKFIKKSAIDEELTPSDMIRRILGLEIKSKKTRQRLSFNLSDEEIALLAERFDIPNADKRLVKQRVADLLIEHVKETK